MAAKETKGSAKQTIFLVILILFAVVFAISLLVKDKHVAKKIIRSGDRAPEFRLQALDGRQVSLSDFRGKVVLVHFWATWCPPCVEEIPTLDRLYRELKGREFELLAVSADEGGVEAVTAFMKKNRLNVPVLLDPDRTVAGLYGTYKFPETYIVDRQGVVRYKAIGPRNWSDLAHVKIVRNIIETR
jgi:peroxiredoxin